jgi:hypothetical protein
VIGKQLQREQRILRTVGVERIGLKCLARAAGSNLGSEPAATDGEQVSRKQ